MQIFMPGVIVLLCFLRSKFAQGMMVDFYMKVSVLAHQL
jgi:hypothetical protein